MAFGEKELYNLECFRARFLELRENYDDLVKSGLRLSGGFRYEDGMISDNGWSLGASRFRIKGLLVDYRHFNGQDEPAHYFSISKTVQRCCRDDGLRDFLKSERHGWSSNTPLSGWHNGFSLDEMVDALFKEEVFHTNPNGKKIRVRLEDIEREMSTSAVWFELTAMVRSRLLIIQNLNWILEPVFAGYSELRVPNG